MGRISTATTLLWIFAFIGIIPAVIHLAEFFGEGLVSTSPISSLYALFLHDFSAVIFLIFFLAGCVCAVFTGKRWLIIPLLPLLMLSIWPVLSQPNADFPVPSGAVIAFDKNCPLGWEPFQLLAGRIPLGAGKGNKDEGSSLLTPRNIGESGGTEKHQLTWAQMPKHHHRGDRVPWGTLRWKWGGVGEYWAHNEGKDGKGKKVYEKYNTEPAGGNEPHNNMPPYYVMQYCKKI